MKVSIIIPTYNYENYIIQAIESVLNQDYPTELLEIIVVDDGSTDNTSKTLKQYIDNNKIIYHYQSNQGKASATQKGIDLSSGEIIFNLDADDYFYPNKINKVVSIFKDHPNVTHVGHPADVYKEDKFCYSEGINSTLLNNPINGNELLTIFLKKRWLFGGGSTFAARTQTLKKLKIPTGIDMYIDEYLIYASSIFGASYLISEALSVWRVHGKNYSVDKSQNTLNKKGKRLLSSSTSMLQFISNSNLYSSKIVKLYELKHLDRVYGFKERAHEKNTSDIFKLIKKILSFKYSIFDLHRYRIFYRVFPSTLIRKISYRRNS